MRPNTSRHPPAQITSPVHVGQGSPNVYSVFPDTGEDPPFLTMTTPCVQAHLFDSSMADGPRKTCYLRVAEDAHSGSFWKTFVRLFLAELIRLRAFPATGGAGVTMAETPNPVAFAPSMSPDQASVRP